MATKIIDDCGCKLIVNIPNNDDCGCNSNNNTSITNPSNPSDNCDCSSYFPISVANGGTGSTGYVNNGLLYYSGSRVTNSNDLTYNGSYITYKDGNESNGYVLTSDAGGNATWQPGGGGIPALVATQIAFGDAVNVMTSSSDLIWDDNNKLFFITDGISLDTINRSYSLGDIAFSGNGQFIALDDGLKSLNIVADNGTSLSGPITGFSYLQLGNNSGSPTAGRIDLIGSVSNQVSIQSPASLTTWIFTLPTTAGTNTYFLQTDGSGVSTWAEGLTPITGWVVNGNTIGNDTSWLGSSDNYDISFKTNGVERVRILKTGEVGIGLNNPDVLFSVSDTTNNVVTVQKLVHITNIGNPSSFLINTTSSYLGGSTNITGISSSVTSVLSGAGVIRVYGFVSSPSLAATEPVGEAIAYQANANGTTLGSNIGMRINFGNATGANTGIEFDFAGSPTSNDYCLYSAQDVKSVHKGRLSLGLIYSPEAKLHILGEGTTSSTYGLKISDSASNLLLTVRDSGLIAMAGLQVGNAGLSSGDLYVDTAANILMNGDLIVARKV